MRRRLDLVEKAIARHQLSTDTLAGYAGAITIPGVPEDDGTADQPESIAKRYLRKLGEDRVLLEAQVDEQVKDWGEIPPQSELVQHHELMLGTVDALVRGELVDENGREADGVMAFMPPGSAKSTYLDVVAPSYFMGRYPGFQVLLTGYASDILRKHARRTRAMCQSDTYRGLFDTKIKADTRAVEDWHLENGSEFMSGGILSGLTGNRCDLLILDDLIQGRLAAESERIRDTTWDAYTDDAVSRLKPHGKQFLIMTRWHEDDPAGRILPENWAGESGFVEGRDGRLWYIICIQAECTRKDDPLGREVGQYLWPEWFPEAHWQPFKKAPRTWTSLFQQLPTSEEGTFFKREWFPRHNRHEILRRYKGVMNIYITGDQAESEDKGDYTFFIVWGVAPDGMCYTLDIWYGQVETDKWTDELIDRIIEFKPLFFIPDKDNIWQAVAPFFRKEMRRRSQRGKVIRCPVELLGGSGSKPIRAQSFQGMASDGVVSIQNDGAGQFLLDQLVKCWTGTYDDGADACGVFGRFYDRIWERKVREKEEVTEVPVQEGLVIEQMFVPPTQDKIW